MYIGKNALLPVLLSCALVQSLNLHPQHLPFVFTHHPHLRAKEPGLDFKNGSCWGYEAECNLQLRYGKPPIRCQSEKWKLDFEKRVDFHYVRGRREEMMHICKAKKESDSFLHCTRHTKYCTGRNIYFDLKSLLQSDGREKFREDLFNVGDIGGFCDLDQTLLSSQKEHKSALQSWYAELQNFTKLPFNPILESHHCDVLLNHTVVFMKLDYGGNMFHHFCDFFNLYVSQHVNGSWFDRDFHIIMWDTATSRYFDPFSVSWKVFSKHPVTALMDMKGKRVCVKDVMYPLLPRMREGMFYNTYVPDTCVGSNLFRAFSEHFLHRMNVSQTGPLIVEKKPKIRLTLLQRGNPSKDNVYRQIKNQDELIKSIEYFNNLEIKVVEYDWKEIPFEHQLVITHNTDVFVGMHGAGLAHFMFLPDWAVAVELYNCGDTHCYSDLARLRGLHYLTWPEVAASPVPYDKGKHKVYGDNPKFWNWKFDVSTFKSLVTKARNTVLDNPLYQIAVRKKSREYNKDEL